ncbi:MAG: galactokinase [Mycobacterium sp.]|jgi:galactokinase|nr:galactokinase [Mycobacterium sp.]
MTIRYAAPGRINLIGEHTDYNLGWALPIALPRRTVVTFSPSDADAVTVRSDRVDGSVRIPLTTKPGDVTGWAAYVAGVVWALRSAGHPVPGGAMSITSEIPMGSGLSSSAALECAALGALAGAAGLRIDQIDQARIAQRAENDYVGAPTGLLDQLSSLFGEGRAALLIDFRELSVQQVPFDPATSGVVLMLIDSRERHGHVGGEYAARRRSCERAATDVGVVSLREIQDRGVSALDGVTDPVDARRARHVLTENQRVFDAVAALNDSDFIEVGRIFSASHASMRDDFDITTRHIDLIADTAVRAGALGARMTGGGFGGCVIALAPAERAEAVGEAVRSAVHAAGYAEPEITLTLAAQGAGAMR